MHLLTVIRNARYLADIGQLGNHLSYRSMRLMLKRGPQAIAHAVRQELGCMAFGVVSPANVLSHLGIEAGQTVVQIGDPLYVTAQALQESDQRITYRGYDCDPDVIAECRTAFSANRYLNFLETGCYHTTRNPKGKTRLLDWQLSETDSSVDLILAPSLFSDAGPPEVRALLKEIARVLRPQGRLVTSAYLYRGEATPRRSRTFQVALNLDLQARQRRLRPVGPWSYPEHLFIAAMTELNLQVTDQTYAAGSWQPGIGRQDLVFATKDSPKNR